MALAISMLVVPGLKWAFLQMKELIKGRSDARSTWRAINNA